MYYPTPSTFPACVLPGETEFPTNRADGEGYVGPIAKRHKVRILCLYAIHSQ